LLEVRPKGGWQSYSRLGFLRQAVCSGALRDDEMVNVPMRMRTAAHEQRDPAHDARCPTGRFRMRTMRKLPVVPVCRGVFILFFRNRLDADPKSEA
jgi:hypothetical protein